jgi:hypothetical protein
MKAAKISTCEARVMQELRAGTMSHTELLDRFPSGIRASRLLKLGYVENDATGYKLADLGRSLCPSRRAIEKAAYLPPAAAEPLKTVKKIATKPTIKAEADMPPHTNVAKQIRDIIIEHPGIEHKELIAKITNNSTDYDETTKAANMISYVIKQGGFKKCDSHLVSTLEKVKLYYTDEAYLKRNDNAQQHLTTKIPTAKEHHEPKTYGTDNVEHEAVAVTTIIKESAVKESLTTEPATNKTSALYTQEGGDHYKLMKIQPVEYILANNIGFAEGSIIKYVSRWKNKNGIQDLKKARHFLDILIEQETA